VVNVGAGLADDFEEFCHKPEAVGGGVQERVNVDGYLNLALKLIPRA